jgi:hypothetical protein
MATNRQILQGPDTCPVCGIGRESKGSACYKYYSCGHSYAKPIGQEQIAEAKIMWDTGKFTDDPPTEG